MNEERADLRLQLARQVAHWTMAGRRLGDLEDLASADSWAGLEAYLSTSVRHSLLKSVERLNREGMRLHATLEGARSAAELSRVDIDLENFRRRYFRTETLLDFYTDAIKARTNPEIASLLRACDVTTRRSMSELLDQVGRPTPQVLTYLEKGLGAQILKAGLRLWDGTTENPAAAIKVVRHNLFRPTSLIHESGHQVAHICGWNDELAAVFENGLSAVPKRVAETWAGWASEVAADTFAFAHTGYASVAGLHDILAGDDERVFGYRAYDPHPVRYLRVLLGTEMCRQHYAAGPWDGLARAWKRAHSLNRADPAIEELIRLTMPVLPKIAELCLHTPMRAFGNRPLTRLLDPGRASPESLLQLENRTGPSLYTSSHWVRAEPVRLLALTGYRAATVPQQAARVLAQQKSWMLKLGDTLQAAA